MKLKVLVADDASFIRDLIKRTLRQHMPFAEVVEAVNGYKARALLKKEAFHLILCDWEMPEVSGLELLEWLRAYELEQGMDKTPFIMVTSRGSRDHVVKAVQAGVSDYIGKPFTAEQLVGKAMKALHKQRKLIQEIMSGRSSNHNQVAAEQQSLLTASSSPTVPASAPASSVNPLLAQTPSSQLVAKPRAAAATAKAAGKPVRFRVGKSVLEASMLDISLTEAVLLTPRYDPATVMEQAVLDIPFGEQDELSLNCLIYGIQAEQKHMDASSLRVRLRLIDQDADKLNRLSQHLGRR